MPARSEGPYVSHEYDRPRPKRGEYDRPVGVADGSASAELRELYAIDPNDTGDDYRAREW